MADRVSVIATVLNEAGVIGTLLDSLLAQTRPPDEVVIVDGGSTDGTLQVVERYAQRARFPIRGLSRAGDNIAQGRNAAIAAAQGTIIAVTDAGVRLEVDWLEQLVAPFERPDPPGVVGGFFLSDPSSLFELALGAVTLPLLEEIVPARFYPSSRSVAFRREAWQMVEGYPEWLDYCEDLLYDFALLDAGLPMVFAPRAVVHFRPRSTLRAFIVQYYRYARGDGKADFWCYRHLVRYGTYLVAMPVLLALSIAHSSLWVLTLLAGMAAMMRKPLSRLRPKLAGLSWRERLVVLCWVPLIRWGGDLAKMCGYPVGIWWRVTGSERIPAKTWPKRRW